MLVLVTGSNGQLGSEIRKLSKNYKFRWFFSERSDLDLANPKKISAILDFINPSIIINCAAYNNVDEAENNFLLASKINFEAVEQIAKWSSLNRCRLLHISTDHVYSSTTIQLKNEDSKINPVNSYGKTKLMGENACIRNNPNSIVIRTSWLYSHYGNNFVKKIIKKMSKQKTINVVNDQYGSPTYAEDLANTIFCIINHELWKPGIYNFANLGNISKYDFVNQIKLMLGYKNIINPISSADFNSVARRPKYSALDSSKIQRSFEIRLIDYKKSLIEFIKILSNE